MSLKVRVIISGDDVVIANLRTLGKDLTNFKSAMSEIGREGTRYFANEVFASQGGAIGEKWKPLNRKYAIYKETGHTTLNKSRQRKNVKSRGYPGTGTKILYKTGKMSRSFDYESTSDSVTIGNTAPQFKYHQSNQARRQLPRRVMLKASPGFKRIVAQIINEDVSRKIERVR